jgi:hypothetical protein
LKRDVQDDPEGEQIADGGHSTSQQFSSTWMNRKRPGPVNRCGNSSRNCLENTYTRPVSMVCTIANGNAVAITSSASTVTKVSRRSVKFLTSENAPPCPSLATAFGAHLPSAAGFLSERGQPAHFQNPLWIEWEFGNIHPWLPCGFGFRPCVLDAGEREGAIAAWSGLSEQSAKKKFEYGLEKTRQRIVRLLRAGKPKEHA